MEDFVLDFWNSIASRNKPIIIKGRAYFIDPDESDAPQYRGMNGAKFTIRFFDGTTVTTRNLWHNGDVPKEFRHRLPDTAEFI